MNRVVAAIAAIAALRKETATIIEIGELLGIQIAPASTTGEKLATGAVAGDPFGKLWIRTIVGVDL